MDRATKLKLAQGDGVEMLVVHSVEAVKLVVVSNTPRAANGSIKNSNLPIQTFHLQKNIRSMRGVQQSDVSCSLEREAQCAKSSC